MIARALRYIPAKCPLQTRGEKTFWTMAIAGLMVSEPKGWREPEIARIC